MQVPKPRFYFLRRSTVGCIAMLLLASGLMAQGKYLDWKMISVIPRPAGPGPSEGLSGPFFGVQGDVIMLAGGLSLASGRVRPRSDVFTGRRGLDGKVQWKRQGQLAKGQALADGAAVSLPEGVLCIGGRNEEGASAAVNLLVWDAEADSVVSTPAPPLPVPLVRAAAAVMDGAVWVAGQVEGANVFLRLDASLPLAEWTWENLPPCPGNPREHACAAVQNDGYGTGFFLMGGHVAGNEDLVMNDTWRYDPSRKSWKRMADIEVDGQAYYPQEAVAIHSGVHHVLLFGAGKSSDRKRMTWEVLAYHTVTDTWAIADTADFGVYSCVGMGWWGGKMLLLDGKSSWLWEISPVLVPNGLRWLDYAVIVLYLVILVWMGAHFMRRGTTTEDYFKAGKRIPWWAAGISIFGTSLSAITYMAVPAKAFGTDWLYFFLSMSQILTVPLVIWLVLPFYRRLNITTAYEYLEMRFHLAIRLIGGLAFLLFQFGRIGIVLFLPAIALSVVSGVSIETCIVVMAVLSVFYTVLGGIEAVIWTDVKQVVVLTLGAVVCLVLMMNGVDGGFDRMADIAGGDGKLRLLDLDFNFNNPTLWVVLGGGIGTNLINQTSDQSFVQRYLTTRTEKAAAWSLLTPAMLVLPVSLLFFGLGTALYGFYKVNPDGLNPVLENADAIFPWYIVSQLPQGLSGLLIAGIFAASMSSLDSSLNSAATVITVDFYKRFVPGASDRRYLAVARVMTVVVGVAGMVFALLMAGTEIKSLWDEFSKVLGLFAGGLAGLFLLGMSSRRATTGGALTGFLVSAGIQYWVSSTAAVHFLLYTFTGLASCYLVGWLASWLFPRQGNLDGLTVGTVRGKKDE